jgi:hypothetical protein
VHAITLMAVELERIDLQVERHDSPRDWLLHRIERRRNVKAEFLERYERRAASRCRFSTFADVLSDAAAPLPFVRDGWPRPPFWSIVLHSFRFADPPRALKGASTET